MLKVHAKKLDAVELLCLEGQIVSGDTEVLQSATDLAADSHQIILDLANVSIVDAHGLGVLLQLRERSLARGIQFGLVNPSESLYRIFEITRLNTVFEINPDLQFLPSSANLQRLPVAA